MEAELARLRQIAADLAKMAGSSSASKDDVRAAASSGLLSILRVKKGNKALALSTEALKDETARSRGSLEASDLQVRSMQAKGDRPDDLLPRSCKTCSTRRSTTRRRSPPARASARRSATNKSTWSQRPSSGRPRTKASRPRRGREASTSCSCRGWRTRCGGHEGEGSRLLVLAEVHSILHCCDAAIHVMSLSENSSCARRMHGRETSWTASPHPPCRR